MNIRDRVIEFIRVPASSLRPSPRNWRTHGTAQRDALKGVLAEIGFAGAELTRRLDDGSLELIDGHLRAEEMGDQPVPVLVTDLSEAEAGLVLATFDPIGARAGANTDVLHALLQDVQTGHQGVAEMLAKLAADAGIVQVEPPQPPAGFGSYVESIETQHQCPKCG